MASTLSAAAVCSPLEPETVVHVDTWCAQCNIKKNSMDVGPRPWTRAYPQLSIHSPPEHSVPLHCRICVVTSTCSVRQLLDRLFHSVSQVGNGASYDLLFFFSFLNYSVLYSGRPQSLIAFGWSASCKLYKYMDARFASSYQDLSVRQQSYSGTNCLTVQWRPKALQRDRSNWHFTAQL